MFRSMNSRPNFTTQNVTKHREVIYPRPDIFILILLSALFHPHFSIRIHPHFIIRILSSAFFHPHPHFSIRHPPSAIRRHPVQLQRQVSVMRELGNGLLIVCILHYSYRISRAQHSK